MNITGLLNQVTQTSTIDKDYERRYNLICEADKLFDEPHTEYAHIVIQTKMLAEILAIAAQNMHHEYMRKARAD